MGLMTENHGIRAFSTHLATTRELASMHSLPFLRFTHTMSSWRIGNRTFKRNGGGAHGRSAFTTRHLVRLRLVVRGQRICSMGRMDGVAPR